MPFNTSWLRQAWRSLYGQLGREKHGSDLQFVGQSELDLADTIQIAETLTITEIAGEVTVADGAQLADSLGGSESTPALAVADEIEASENLEAYCTSDSWSGGDSATLSDAVEAVEISSLSIGDTADLSEAVTVTQTMQAVADEVQVSEQLQVELLTAPDELITNGGFDSVWVDANGDTWARDWDRYKYETGDGIVYQTTYEQTPPVVD